MKMNVEECTVTGMLYQTSRNGGGSTSGLLYPNLVKSLEMWLSQVTIDGARIPFLHAE